MPRGRTDRPAHVRSRRRRRAAARLRLPAAQRVQVLMQVGPWALRHAVGGVDLLCVYYEREMDKDLEQLRSELAIEPLFKSRKA